jgi:hypothetical protein
MWTRCFTGNERTWNNGRNVFCAVRAEAMLGGSDPPDWESQIWDSKIWSWVPRDLERKMTYLARTSSDSKWQTRPLVRGRESATPTNPQLSDSNRNLVLGPRRGWHQDRLAYWPSVNTWFELFEPVESCSCEKWEAASWDRRQLGNTEEGERPHLEAATKQRLVKSKKTLCVL